MIDAHLHTIDLAASPYAWGSDWSVCTLNASLAAWVAASHARLAGRSVEERENLLSGNAHRLWRLDP
jgi:predicted TIM-barrel fold metal-dependent hydrolase